MMRSFIPNLPAAACVLALITAFAPFAVLAQEAGKYGFVNISKVITQSEEGRAEATELESLGAQKERELNARRQELQDLVKQYEQSVNEGQPDTELRDRVQKLKRELERDVRQAQSDVDTSRQDRIQAIGRKVVELVRQYGQENGYTAIFRTDSGQVVYVDETVDITERVIEAYNQAHPVE